MTPRLAIGRDAVILEEPGDAVVNDVRCGDRLSRTRLITLSRQAGGILQVMGESPLVAAQ